MQEILDRKLVNPKQALDPIHNIALINCCQEVPRSLATSVQERVPPWIIC